MNFAQLIGTTDDSLRFSEDGYFVWCGSMFRYNGKYYLAYSRWRRELGFGAWVTDSEICLGRADTMLGKFEYVLTIRTKDTLGRWDSSCAHNPTVLAYDGRFYLYYMGNDGDFTPERGWWDYRNRQRIGVASAANPESLDPSDGGWTFSEKPLIDVSPDGIDSLMVSNPSVTATPDGRFLMVYKAVSSGGTPQKGGTSHKDGTPPKGGRVICGAAFSDYPDRDFVKVGRPIMVNPENDWSVEDPFIWYGGERYYALVKDFQGYFTRSGGSTQRGAVALFESKDGIDWQPSEYPLAFERKLYYPDRTLDVANLERPQLYFEDGVPRLLICACSVDAEHSDVFSVRIKLKHM